MNHIAAKNTEIVKQIAHQLGFLNVGISNAQKLTNEAQELEAWLNNGSHGTMQYMENHFEKRIDPQKLVQGSQSVISLLYNYSTHKQQHRNVPKISRYAYGRDYHKVIRKKLKQFILTINENIGNIQGRAFVDSAPVLEKAWAKRAGLGWQGKNTNLINPKAGSYFFLAEIISDLKLLPDGPIKDYCGSCTKCVDACPTDALNKPYQIDASKCISYLTIELKTQIPNEFKGKMDNWLFGCDVCQEVCPWNRFSTPHTETAFMPKDAIRNSNAKSWEEITDQVFQERFNGSALKRAGLKKIKNTLQFIKSK